MPSPGRTSRCVAVRVVELLAIGQRADQQIIDAVDRDLRLVGVIAGH
jgi:hypothetical protein